MSKLGEDRVVVLIGARSRGKSMLVKDLLYHHRDVPVGCVISPTESVNKFYGDMVPSIFIHDEYSPELFERVIRRQKLAMAKVHEEKAQKEKGGRAVSRTDPRAFAILDDCLYNADIWKRDTNIKFAFLNGRHVKLLLVITMQFALGIPPNLRTNVDYVFILKENIISNRRRIYESYAGQFPTFDLFCQVMDQTTNNYECLVIDNTTQSNRLEDMVFWYKASLHEDFRIGAPEYWKLSKEADEAREDEVFESEPFDPAKFLKKRTGPNVSVKKRV